MTQATKRSTARKPIEPVTVSGLCDTCYDVHPVRVAEPRQIASLANADHLHGVCPVCRCERYHVLIRAADDPRRDQDEREQEAERIARDAELTWHLSELQRRPGVRVFLDEPLGCYAMKVTRYLDDGEFVIAFDWDGESHAQKLQLLRAAARRVSDDGIAEWSLHPASEEDDGVACAVACFYKTEDVS